MDFMVPIPFLQLLNLIKKSSKLFKAYEFTRQPHPDVSRTGTTPLKLGIYISQQASFYFEIISKITSENKQVTIRWHSVIMRWELDATPKISDTAWKAGLPPQNSPTTACWVITAPEQRGATDHQVLRPPGTWLQILLMIIPRISS